MSEEDNKNHAEDSVEGDVGDSEGQSSSKKSQNKSFLKNNGAGKSRVVKFGKNIEIYCDNRLPEYDNGPIKAYQATGKVKSNESYFVLVCEPHLTPRYKAVSSYSSIVDTSLPRLVAAGIVYWPPLEQERYVFIYGDNIGKRIFKEENKAAFGWKQDYVMASIVKPLIGVLYDFRNKEFVHGSIRPSNMFDGGAAAGSLEKIILGDCLSVPFSYLNSALYETIERSMMDPIGRGEGACTDDMYALGVSLSIMLRSVDPLEGLSDAQILERKMVEGSYSAITGKDRFKGSILELLRGVLHDEAPQRWTVDEALTWIDGRRLSPKQSSRKKKAARPISFNNNKYFQLPFLAIAVADNLQETQRIVESGELYQWLERSLEDEEALDRAGRAVVMAREKGTGVGYDDRVASILSIALDPFSPIRYKGLHLAADGVGTALAEAVALKHDIKSFVEIISHNVAMSWLVMQERSHVDVSALASRFDACRNFIRQTKPGFGIERCLYLLCPETQCLSDVLANYIVLTPEDMVYAFENICAKGVAPELFLDRHSISFLSVKDAKVVDLYIYDLGSSDRHRNVMGNLKCLAAIQKRSVLPKFTAIATAFLSVLPAVYDRYHDSNVRDKIEKSINEYAAKGDLGKMANLLDNAEIMDKDMNAFRSAVIEYSNFSIEYNNLEERLGDKKTFGKATGKHISAIVSSITAFVIIIFVVFISLSSNAIF